MKSEGYVLIAFGSHYERMAANLVHTLRLHGDTRPVHIINQSNLITNLDLYGECNVPFEKCGTYPKITLDLHSPFDHTIYLDCDMFCGSNPDKVWNHFKSNSDEVKQMGIYPSLWAPQFKDNFELKYQKKLHLCHGSMIYVRKGDKSSNFFETMRNDVWGKYYEYSNGDSTNKGLRYGRADQVIYSIASALHDIVPSNMLEYPFVTHVSTPDTFLGVPQRKIFFRENVVDSSEDIVFFHMWSKIGTPVYDHVYRSIVK